MRPATTNHVALNLNARAEVVLTADGAHRLNSYNAKVMSEPQVEAGKRCVFQLWELMHIFGPALTMGRRPVFVDNMIEVRP